jgi:diguanylate cyclase (GGDEF)-like protein
MAASDHHLRSNRARPVGGDCLAPDALGERLEEEISRAERQGTLLSCLLVVIDELDELAREHGGALREQTIEYVAGALRRELRRFDRVGLVHSGGSGAQHELLIILPGADSPRGEIVARRALERLRTIKLETEGRRQPLHVSMGLVAWRQDASAESMLAHARTAMRSARGENGNGAAAVGAPAGVPEAQPVDPQPLAGVPPPVDRLRGQ